MRNRLIWAALLLVIGVGLLPFVVPEPPLKEGISLSQAVYDSRGNLLRLTTSEDEKYRLWIPLEQMSPYLIEGTLLHEDRLFWWHPGVNPVSVVRAVWETYIVKDRRIGGSTITMQLARLRYDINSRTITGKLVQMLRAVQLEIHYSKREILEAYLNLAPYGFNIEGAAAASLVYFNKRSSKLTIEEALTLCVIPQSPAERVTRNSLREPDSGNSLFASRNALYDRWVEVHPEDKSHDELFTLPVMLKSPARLPFHAPHLVDDMLQKYTGTIEIETNLDLGLQQMIERITRSYIARKRPLGIRNASVMLLDYRDMEVKAVLGSADFFDDSIQGQVNGTRARRSPGSTIKPFIYALSFDQGKVHPMTMLKDTRSRFGTYSPENFDHQFIGPIKVRDALVRSRNVPALDLAAGLDPPGIYGLLQRVGVSGLQDESFYGLAIAMGGVELTMEELVELYAMLAGGGMHYRARYLQDEPQGDGIDVLSPEASFLVLDILKDNPRPGNDIPHGWTRSSTPVRWKTGTSFGFRDAWAVGIVGQYVLAVWVGDFSGEGNPAFVGRDAAGPLFFRIIDSLRSSEELKERDFERKADLAEVEVCSVSGRLPNRSCRLTVKTKFIPGVSPIDVCEIHREVHIDPKTGMRVCGTKEGSISAIYEFWPSDLLKLFMQAGIPRRTPPPPGPSCSTSWTAETGIPPSITSPQNGVSYTMRSKKKDERIPFIAVSDADSGLLYWFVNENFVGKSPSEEPFFWPPKPGDYVVRVVDDRGRASSRNMNVELID